LIITLDEAHLLSPWTTNMTRRYRGQFKATPARDRLHSRAGVAFWRERHIVGQEVVVIAGGEGHGVR
jgi:hypothetical protein